jgi:hypothetical protein
MRLCVHEHSACELGSAANNQGSAFMSEYEARKLDGGIILPGLEPVKRDSQDRCELTERLHARLAPSTLCILDVGDRKTLDGKVASG